MRGIFSKLNISKALLTRGLSLVVVFATLVASYAALSMNATLGWFAKNEKVTASGMITQAYAASFKVSYVQLTPGKDENGTATVVRTPVENPSQIIANMKVPGQEVTFEITIQSTGVYDVKLTGVGLEAPGVDDELPKVTVSGTDVQYHYLSTQLTTQVLSVTDSDSELSLKSGTQVEPPRVLRDTDGTGRRINYFDWLNQDVAVLSSGESIVLTVKISFVDQVYNGGNQNVFKNFGERDENGKPINGYCGRQLFITWDD